MVKYFLCLFFFVWVFPAPLIKAQDAYDLTIEMFARTREINTLRYEMKKLERIGGKMVEQRSFTKLRRQPLQVYIRQLYPKEGVEVLYLENEDSSTALVNPNGFPWFNLKLDPLGSTMRKDQHHTLLNAGFDHVVNILEYLFEKHNKNIRGMVNLMEEKSLNGRECWVIKLENPDFKFETYTLLEGENIDSLAKRLMLSQHMIVELNDNLKSVDDVYAGKKIIIPSDYSPEMILYIDKKSGMPVVMKVYDKDGLYEHYEYTKVEINPYIDPKEFSPEYEEYGF